MSVVDILEISERSVTAFVGCGGKTSLIELVSGKLRGKVLVSPTTKMFPMRGEGVMLCETTGQCEEHVPQAGVQCFGRLNRATGKLESLPEEVLASLVPAYDVTLLEADGSAGFSCKGWLKSEPVVPAFCTGTVGVVTMDALGKPATEENVFRLKEFLSLCSLKEGDAITAQALEAMVCAPEGMFKNSVGNKYLCVNRVEDEPASSAALAFLLSIKEKYPGFFRKTFYGSVRHDIWQEV
jgi:probable selenium-dependent hydroxylase accessory protein YqeC